MSRAKIKIAMISKGKISRAVIGTVPMVATVMIASKNANPTSASLILAVKANARNLTAHKASANRVNVQSAASGLSAPIARIGANALSRAIRTSLAAIP
jgi:hypothetical protein